MTICSLGNDNLLSRCVYSDILNRKFPPKKPFRPENSDCAECVTFSLPRIKFNLSSGVFERRTATRSRTSSLFICLDATPHCIDRCHYSYRHDLPKASKNNGALKCCSKEIYLSIVHSKHFLFLISLNPPDNSS